GGPVRAAFTAVVKSASIVPIRGRRSVRIVLEDGDGDARGRARAGRCTLHAFWFFLARGVLEVAKPGARVLVVGKVTVEPGKPARTAHPDLLADAPDARAVRARYPRLGPSGAAL